MDTDCKVLVFFMRHFSSSGCNIPRNTELEKFIVRKHKLELSLRNSLHSERHKEWLPHGMQTEKYRICSLQNYSTAPILFNGTPIGNSNSGNEVSTPCVELYCLLNSNGKDQVGCINELADRMRIPQVIFEPSPSHENQFLISSNYGDLRFFPIKPQCGIEFKDTKGDTHMFASISNGQERLILPYGALDASVPWRRADYSYLNVPPERTIPLNTNIIENEIQEPIILTDSLSLSEQNSKSAQACGVIFSSWYGDLEGIAHCDWNSFKGRKVYYLLYPHSGFTCKQIYETAQAAYEALSSFASMRFVTYFAPNQNLSSGNPTLTAIPRVISPETFLDEMKQENNRAQFSRLISTIPEPAEVPVKSLEPFISPYMNKGSINIFQPKTGSGVSLYEFYMPLAMACAQRHPLWGFDTGNCNGGVLQIYGDGEISTSQGRGAMMRNICLENKMLAYANDKYTDFPLKNRTLDIMEGTANVINSCLSQHQGTGLLILDFSALNELFLNNQSPLLTLLQYLQRSGITIWLILRKALSFERLRMLNPDSIFTIDKKKCASASYMHVDIHLNRDVPPYTVTKMKFVFDNERKAYVIPKKSRSKYEPHVQTIRNMTIQCIPEVEIARQLGIKLATLKQIKRIFKIRVNKAPKARRKDISKKIFELHQQGKLAHDIAGTLGVSVSHVKKRIFIELAKSQQRDNQICGS